MLCIRAVHDSDSALNPVSCLLRQLVPLYCSLSSSSRYLGLGGGCERDCCLFFCSGLWVRAGGHSCLPRKCRQLLPLGFSAAVSLYLKQGLYSLAIPSQGGGHLLLPPLHQSQLIFTGTLAVRALPASPGAAEGFRFLREPAPGSGRGFTPAGKTVPEMSCSAPGSAGFRAREKRSE